MNLRHDPSLLPPLILTSEPGSFAQNTLRVRIPKILRDTIDQNDFSPDIIVALEEFYRELQSGFVRPLQEDVPDAAAWNRASESHFGHSWLDVPWYWAEAYFYRRLLEATRYFQTGPWHGVDPFASTKRREWAPDAAPAAIHRLLPAISGQALQALEQLLHGSLWGNRTDLSYMIAAHLGATAAPAAERENLLVDDSQSVADFILANAGLKVGILADNAGTELLMDMALADFLLSNELASQVTVHLKPQPFYVSDAMIKDLAEGTDALIAQGGAAASFGRRLDAHVAAGELVPLDHGFYTSSRFYFDMPDDLFSTLGRLDLVFVKGDANYRRLVGDAHWSPTTAFVDLLDYFPTPVVALRTFKSELVVGLQPGQAEQIALADPNWLVNGRRGVIQASLQRRQPAQGSPESEAQ